MLKAAIMAITLILASANVEAAMPLDESFIRHEAQGGAYELELARLGQSRAVRQDVRNYAAGLVNDHEIYNAALRELAQVKNIAVPLGLDPIDQRRLDSLAEMRGAAFDPGFIDEVARINDVDMRAFREQASRTTDADIRAFVLRFMEIDEHHRLDAIALTKQNVASQAPIIQPPQTGDTMATTPPSSGSSMPIIMSPTAK